MAVAELEATPAQGSKFRLAVPGLSESPSRRSVVSFSCEAPEVAHPSPAQDGDDDDDDDLAEFGEAKSESKHVGSPTRAEPLRSPVCKDSWMMSRCSSVLSRQSPNAPAGVVHDFVRGFRRAGDTVGVSQVEETVCKLFGQADPASGIARPRMSVAVPVGGFAGFDDEQSSLGRAMAIVRREALFGDVLAKLMRFWKAEPAAPAEWKTPALEAFRRKCKEIALFKRDIVCLRDQVKIFCEVHPPLVSERPAREPEESLHERRARTAAFWEGYHTTFRRVEAPAAAWMSLRANKVTLSEAASDGFADDLLLAAAQVGARPRSVGETRGMRPGRPPALAAAAAARGIAGMPRPASTPALMRPTRSSPTAHSSPTARGCTLAPLLRPPREAECRRAQLRRVTTPVSLVGDRDAVKKPYQRAQRSRGLVQRTVEEPPTCGRDDMVSSMSGYLWSCENNGLLPRALPCVTGHSLKLSACTMVDNDLLGVVAGLRSGGLVLEEADLEGNTALTDKSLVPLIEKFFRTDGPSGLKRLSLNSCRQAGCNTLRTVVRLLAAPTGASGLLSLDLSGVVIAAPLHPELCGAIGDHPSLRSVSLSGVGLGIKAGNAKGNITRILGSTTITELDISWNCFSAEIFRQLAMKIVETQRLKSLNVANCSAASDRLGDAPILFFMEPLSNDDVLTHLDVSLNRINYSGALVLEDTLARHKRLEKLNLAQNPLGVLGVRSVLRLLARTSSALIEFNIDACSNGPTVDATRRSTDSQHFNASNPGGRYELNLIRPYHRALLRMLYKACEAANVDPAVAITDIAYSEGQYKHPQRKANGVRHVPESGVLQLTLSTECSMEKVLAGMDDAPLTAILERYFSQTRLRPSFHKVIPLFAQWRRMSGQQLEQVTVLKALSKDFVFTYAQIEELAHKEKQIFSHIVNNLLHCVLGGQTARYLTFMLTPTFGEFIWNLVTCAKLLAFNIENPTGHYILNLENCSDYAVAEQLLLLDRWESNVCRRRGAVPTSQKGDYTQIRNEKWDKHVLLGVKTISEWRLPVVGELEFDYVSARRARDLVPLDQGIFDRILLALHRATCGPAEKVWVMRQTSHMIGLTASQLRELMGALQEDFMRAELFVCFYLRVTDIYNEKVFRVRFASNPGLMKELRHRLGEVTLFPFIQPEQSTFSWDLSVNDERLAASILIYLAARESENFRNLRNPKYVKADGTLDRQFETCGVSRSWEDASRMNDSGTFTSSYMCSPQDCQYEKRVQLFEKYTGFTVNATREEVMWWAALDEAPPDVLLFLEFLVAHYPDTWEPFRIIDDGNGVLTLREFEEGMKVLGCEKFKGPNERQRIQNVFRYLDPSGEGEVSMEEWQILEFLWKEMQQSIREFVRFLERVYGEHGEDFLDIAWQEIDDDDSGDITETEWVQKVLEDLQYFGPSDIIFRYLDKDDKGSVSYEEFAELEKFRRRARSSRRNASVGASRGSDASQQSAS